MGDFWQKGSIDVFRAVLWFPAQVVMCVGWQGGIWEKDWGELLPKAPSDNWNMKNAVSDRCYTVVL